MYTDVRINWYTFLGMIATFIVLFAVGIACSGPTVSAPPQRSGADTVDVAIQLDGYTNCHTWQNRDGEFWRECDNGRVNVLQIRSRDNRVAVVRTELTGSATPIAPLGTPYPRRSP